MSLLSDGLDETDTKNLIGLLKGNPDQFKYSKATRPSNTNENIPFHYIYITNQEDTTISVDIDIETVVDKVSKDRLRFTGEDKYTSGKIHPVPEIYKMEMSLKAKLTQIISSLPDTDQPEDIGGHYEELLHVLNMYKEYISKLPDSTVEKSVNSGLISQIAMAADSLINPSAHTGSTVVAHKTMKDRLKILVYGGECMMNYGTVLGEDEWSLGLNVVDTIAKVTEQSKARTSMIIDARTLPEKIVCSLMQDKDLPFRSNKQLRNAIIEVTQLGKIDENDAKAYKVLHTDLMAPGQGLDKMDSYLKEHMPSMTLAQVFRFGAFVGKDMPNKESSDKDLALQLQNAKSQIASLEQMIALLDEQKRSLTANNTDLEFKIKVLNNSTTTPGGTGSSKSSAQESDSESSDDDDDIPALNMDAMLDGDDRDRVLSTLSPQNLIAIQDLIKPESKVPAYVYSKLDDRCDFIVSNASVEVVEKNEKNTAFPLEFIKYDLGSMGQLSTINRSTNIGDRLLDECICVINSTGKHRCSKILLLIAFNEGYKYSGELTYVGLSSAICMRLTGINLIKSYMTGNVSRLDHHKKLLRAMEMLDDDNHEGLMMSLYPSRIFIDERGTMLSSVGKPLTQYMKQNSPWQTKLKRPESLADFALERVDTSGARPSQGSAFVIALPGDAPRSQMHDESDEGSRSRRDMSKSYQKNKRRSKSASSEDYRMPMMSPYGMMDQRDMPYAGQYYPMQQFMSPYGSGRGRGGGQYY